MFVMLLLLQGKRVLVVDDVITAGTAIREAMDILYEAEAVPAGVVIALDRQVRYPPIPLFMQAQKSVFI